MTTPTYLLTAAKELAIYNWVKAAMPAGWTVIWSDPKEQEEQADRPAYPYAAIKISDSPQGPLGASLAWKENRITVTADDTTTTVTVNQIAYTVTVTRPATKTKAAIATELAALLNAALPTLLVATTLGGMLILTRKAGKEFDTAATANCTLGLTAGGTPQDVFVHTEHSELTLSVNTLSRTGGHLAALKALLASKRLAASAKILRDAGFGYRSESPVRDLTFLSGSENIHRAQVDIVLGYVAETEEVSGQIDTVTIDADLTTDKGTTISVAQTINI